MVLCEVCVDTAAGALAAERGGAARVELCADLVEGGTTPSAGTIAVARGRTSLELVVLVRPRAGDFTYDALELEVLEHDIRNAKELGADGVALGVLTRAGDVDRVATARLVAAARPLPVTFHRAFDRVADPRAALDALVELGVDRLLTSAQAVTAWEGRALLAELVERAAGRLAIIAAGGVRAPNVAALVRATGVQEVHFSARTPRGSAESAERPARGPVLGSGTPAGETSWLETDEQAVSAVVRAAAGRAG